MRAKELVERCIDIARNYRTIYMWGCVGSPVTASNIAAKAAQYPDWYTSAKRSKFESLIGKDYFGFDCVNMIKAVLWGWNGDRSKTYGGANYASNGVPDVSANGAFQLCKNATTNFRQEIPVGAALWCSGHIGLYIGDGLAVECTPAWKNCVQITAVRNISEKAGYNARTWTKWGLLPWVDYTTETLTHPAPAESGTGYTDVPANAWYTEAVKRVTAKGLMSGYGDGRFGPDDPVTRAQLASVLDRLTKEE